MKNKEPKPAEPRPVSSSAPEDGRGDVAGEWEPTREELRRILKARARALARVDGADAAVPCVEIVEFALGCERYGVEACYVREVLPLLELTPLPCTPPFVLGIMNMRGNILSVIDIRKFFDLPERGLTDLSKVIVLENEKMEFGILADAILGTRPVPLRDLQRSLPTLTEIRAEYLKGVTEERLILLDGAKILADGRIVVHETV